jgi:hypothetical protein
MEYALKLGWTVNIFYEDLNKWYVVEMTHPNYSRWVMYPTSFSECGMIVHEHAKYIQSKHLRLE